MLNKLWTWLKASNEADQHLENASAAGRARWEHLHDSVNGVERVVDHHLDRIEKRELLLCDFCEMIAESPTLNDEEGEA